MAEASQPTPLLGHSVHSWGSGWSPVSSQPPVLSLSSVLVPAGAQSIPVEGRDMHAPSNPVGSVWEDPPSPPGAGDEQPLPRLSGTWAGRHGAAVCPRAPRHPPSSVAGCQRHGSGVPSDASSWRWSRRPGLSGTPTSTSRRCSLRPSQHLLQSRSQAGASRLPPQVLCCLPLRVWHSQWPGVTWELVRQAGPGPAPTS